MQKTGSLSSRSEQTFFERVNPTTGNIAGREVKDGSRLEEQNGFVKNLFIRVVSLENALCALKESQKKVILELKSELAKSSLVTYRILNLENCLDQVSADSMNAINIVKTQVSILEKNITRRLEDLESEIEYNEKETANAFDKICLLKAQLESQNKNTMKAAL